MILRCFPEVTKMFKFNQNQRSYKTLFIIYPDLESLIGKTDACKDNPENSSTAKVEEHIPL